MIVSPEARAAQIKAWEESIQDSQRRGDLAEVARKTEILNKVKNRESQFLGYPYEKILAKQLQSDKSQ